MRVVVVMPRGSQMSRARPNSMETVAGALLAPSRLKAQTHVICDAGAPDPAAFEAEGARMLDQLRQDGVLLGIRTD